MRIQDYTLTKLEEDRVRIILELFRSAFPSARIDEREEIIGIGEEGRYLFCYFSRIDGKTCVKFKKRDWLDLEDAAAILSDAEKTVALFKAEPLTISRKPKEKPLADGQTAEFDLCSRRLRHVLYNNRIFTVRDLLSYTPEQLRRIKGIGRKSIRELCAFLKDRIAEDERLAARVADTGWAACQRNPYCAAEWLKPTHRALPLRVEDIRTDFEQDEEMLAELLEEIKDNALAIATEKLRESERGIFCARLGLGQPPQTLQAIGEIHAITRERVRQRVSKAMRRVGGSGASTEPLLALEEKKIELIARIEAITAGAFLSFLVFTNTAEPLLRFIATYYLHTDADIKQWEKQCRALLISHRRGTALAQKMQAYNERVYGDIRFPCRRPITEADFGRLRSAAPDREASVYLFQGEAYPYATAAEKTVLRRFLVNQTFKRVRTHALRIPLERGFYSPSLQCLTHDGHLVIVDVLPLFHMCVYENIKKFEALKSYCERYGFGYLIIDDRGHSFETCTEENAEFSAAMLRELAQMGCVTFVRYALIYKQTKANYRHLLALVKNHNLHLSLPFLLKK